MASLWERLVAASSSRENRLMARKTKRAVKKPAKRAPARRANGKAPPSAAPRREQLANTLGPGTRLPGMSAQRPVPARKPVSAANVRAKHKEFLFPCVANYYEEPVVLVEGQGCFAKDADGREYLDFFGGILTLGL